MEEPSEFEEDKTIDVGKQIRLLREQRKFSQKQLAEASGISRNALSLIERGHTSPTVSTLKSVAKALSVDINAFFQPFNEARIVFTKSVQRPRLLLDQGELEDLGLGMFDPLMTPLILQLEPGARSGPALSHEGQDFIYCLSGEILYSVNGRSFVLEPGDSLLFDGILPHRFTSTGTEAASMLIVLSTPRDSAEYIAGHFPDES